MTKKSYSHRHKWMIGTLAIAVAILISGLYLYSHNSRKKLANQTPTTQTTTQQPAANPTDAPAQPATTYLDIQEIGKKFALESSVADAVYAPFGDTSLEGTQSFGFSTKAITAQGGDNCSAAHGILGAILITTRPDWAAGRPDGIPTVDNKTIFKEGNIYYVYIYPQTNGVCSSAVPQEVIRSAQAAIQRSFATLQPDK